jgi:hypothetical protein
MLKNENKKRKKNSVRTTDWTVCTGAILWAGLPKINAFKIETRGKAAGTFTNNFGAHYYNMNLILLKKSKIKYRKISTKCKYWLNALPPVVITHDYSCQIET